MDSDDKVQPFFCTYCERAAVWAAFRDRTFGGIARSNSLSFFYENNCLFSKAASEGTKKNAHTQEKLVFSPYHPIISHSFAPY